MNKASLRLRNIDLDELLPISSDADLEEAVTLIGQVVLRGLPKGAGFIFHAGSVRHILSEFRKASQ